MTMIPDTRVQVKPQSAKSGAEPHAWKGRTVGRFVIRDLLGQGGMGTVFRAEDKLLKRQIALKVMVNKKTDLEKPENRTFRTEQFLCEARSAATLEHPNVVHIYEVGTENQLNYIAMELVEGGNLNDLVKNGGPMEYHRACQLGAEAAEALAFAHQAGIIHRDIKPANLMLTRTGRCKVTDFGLCSVDTHENEFRLPSETVGTVHFMAPEVASGQAATEASDIYSLGATIYTLLSGRQIFEGRDREKILRLQQYAQPVSLLTYRPDLPEALVTAVEKALAKNPEKRYKNMAEFAAILRMHTIVTAHMSSSDVVVPRNSLKAILEKNQKYIPYMIGAVVAVVTLAGVAVYLMLPPKPDSAPVVDAGSKNTVTGTIPQPTNPVPNLAVGTGNGNLPTHVAPVVPVVTPKGVTPTPNVTVPPDTTTTQVYPASSGPELLALCQLKPEALITVEGTVRSARTSRTGKVFTIKFSGNSDQGAFHVACFPAIYPSMQQTFGGENGSGLEGKKIRVTGNLGSFQGAPQITLRSPDQITIVN